MQNLDQLAFEPFEHALLLDYALTAFMVNVIYIIALYASLCFCANVVVE